MALVASGVTVGGSCETASMAEQQTHIVTLDLTDSDRYAILVNALQDYASDALDKAQREDSTTAERDHFQSVAATATELIDELG